jgi:hypothetical protein
MRRAIIISVVCLGVLLLAAARLVLLDNPKARVAVVQRGFAQMRGVKVTYISDLEKQASEAITAYVEVQGKGEIGFTGLCPESFTRAKHVLLHGIGPYSFRTRELVKGGEYYGYSVDIGPDSPIPAARQLGIASVPSAVAHYDDLLALIAHWPVTTNEWPSGWPVKTAEWSSTSDEEIHFPYLPRGDYYFCLKRQDAEASR